MPRVTLFIDSLGSGGAQRQVAEIAAALPALGWHVQVSWYNDQDRFTSVPDNAQPRRIKRDGPTDLAGAWRMRRAFSSKQTDLVHAFLPMPSLYAAMARQLGGAPVISAVRCSAQVFDVDPAQGAAYVAAANLCDHVTVNALDVVPWLTARGVPRGRISYVPNLLPAAVAARKPSETAEKKAEETGVLARFGLGDGPAPLLLVGRFDVYKNQDGLLRAVKRLVDDGVTVPPVLLVGRPTDPARVEAARELAAQAGMPKVVIAGPTDDVLTLIEAAAAVVLCSHSEGTPNVLMEAMGLGCPAVAVPVGQVPELVVDGRTAILARDTSDEAIAEGLRRLLAMSAAQRSAMGQAARKDLQQRFGAPVIAAKLDALYRRMLMPRQRPLRRLDQAMWRGWTALRRSA